MKMTRTEQGDVYEKCQQRLTQGGTRRFRECLRSFTHSSRLSFVYSFIHSCTHLFNRRGRLWYPRFSSRHPIRPRHCRAPLTHVALPMSNAVPLRHMPGRCRRRGTGAGWSGWTVSVESSVGARDREGRRRGLSPGAHWCSEAGKGTGPRRGDRGRVPGTLAGTPEAMEASRSACCRNSGKVGTEDPAWDPAS